MRRRPASGDGAVGRRPSPGPPHGSPLHRSAGRAFHDDCPIGRLCSARGLQPAIFLVAAIPPWTVRSPTAFVADQGGAIVLSRLRLPSWTGGPAAGPPGAGRDLER